MSDECFSKASCFFFISTAYKYFTCGSTYAKGDVNGDGKVNMFDYVALKSHCLNKTLLDADKQTRADLTGDGKINMFDYVALKKLVVKGS